MPITATLLAVVSGALLMAPDVSHAQSCTPVERPYFEFQVEEPARFRPDSTHPHLQPPRIARRAASEDDLLVQFVVDTAGVPVASTFKVLKTPSPTFADSALAALPEWRFRAARVGGCKVPQLVQTLVDR